MPRYIDADALYKETEKKIKEANSYRMAVVDSEFLDIINDADEADVVPRDEVEMHGASYYFKLEQAIESSQRFMAEHDAALAKKIFEEIEALILRYYNDEWYTVPDLGSDVAQLKEKYTKGGAEE